VITAVYNAIPHFIVHIVADHIAAIIVFHHPIIALMSQIGETGPRDLEIIATVQLRNLPYPKRNVIFVECKPQKYFIAHRVDMNTVPYTSFIRITIMSLKRNLYNQNPACLQVLEGSQRDSIKLLV
jgi:hypothetical protein